MPIKPKKVAVSKKETTSKKPRKSTEKQLSGGDKKIHEHPKANSNGFAQNPQNINKNGRPKKGISAILNKIKELGYEQPTKQDIESTYLSLLNCTIIELAEIADDPNSPILAKIIAKDLSNGGHLGTLERLLDRAIGRTTEKVEMNSNVNTIMTTDDQKMYQKILENFKK